MEDIAQTGTSYLKPHVFTYTEDDISRLLGETYDASAFLNTPSMVDLRRKYEFETKRIISLELHLTTLIEYYRHQRIPRGMRTPSKPNLFFQETIYRTKFEMISNKYAFDLMLLNIELLRAELSKVRARLETVEKLLKTTLNAEDLAKFLQKHEDFLKKFKSDLEETKRRKWHRDIQDYETGRVYSWNVPRQTFFNNSFQNVDNRKNVDFQRNPASEPFLGERPMEGPTGDPQGAGANTDTGASKGKAQRSRHVTRSTNRTK